jgi:hypothetical protein
MSADCESKVTSPVGKVSRLPKVAFASLMRVSYRVLSSIFGLRLPRAGCGTDEHVRHFVD